MKILGAVIAGGKSARMGRDKALVLIDGVAMIERVISRLAHQVDEVVINCNGNAGRFAGLGLSVVPDLLAEPQTPLRGLHAVLHYGRSFGFDAALSVPSDAPFLPLDLVERLTEAGFEKGAAIARSNGQNHHLTGLWTVALLPGLERHMRDGGLTRVQDFAKLAEAETVTWADVPHDPFFNVNTPADLALAERIARGEL